MVVINSGPVDAMDSPNDVPKEKWDLLLGAWSGFVKREFPHDCRELNRYINQAEQYGMWEVCGFDSIDDFINRGLGLEPEIVNWAMQGLEIYDGPIGFKQAASKGEQRAKRNLDIHRMREDGMTQQAIADEVGVPRTTVQSVLTKNVYNTEISSKPKRNPNARTINISKDAKRAANQIRDKFGDEFAKQLIEALTIGE